MNISKKILALIIIISLVLGYILSMFIPYEFWTPRITDNILTRGQYYENLINSFAAIFTFMAVVVALFSEDIKSFLKKVKYEIVIPNETSILEELTEGSNGTRRAKCYYGVIQITNKGNINALDCEIILEKIEFTSDAIRTPILIFNENNLIPWKYNDSSKSTYIPSLGKKYIHFLDIIAPERLSSPGGEIQNIPPILKIAGKEIPSEYLGGKWIVYFYINSSNAKPVLFTLTIEWNGAWHERLSEMKNYVTVNIVKQ